MRRWVYLSFGLFVFTTEAGQLPLTGSEISLMLRTGYSSTSLMQELSRRHFANTLDTTKEQTLIKAGASAELIAALKNGTYSLLQTRRAGASRVRDCTLTAAIARNTRWRNTCAMKTCRG